MITTKRIIRILNEAGERSFKKGYVGDAAEYWAKAKNLELQEKMINSLSGMEKQVKYMWQSLDKLEVADDEVRDE
jgi:hypothetical protein